MERSTLGLDPALCKYVHENNPTEHPALAGLRATTAPHPEGRFQISVEQGFLLQFLIRVLGARRAIEIGTYTGYSALAIALALPRQGTLIACDVNAEWTDLGRKFWEEAGVASKIDLRIAPAVDTLAALKPNHEDAFDFAFIDADKENYDAYYEECLRILRPGGIAVLDNMLRRGKVINPADDTDAQLVHKLNLKIAKDERVDRVLLALADGMTLVRKR